MDERRDEIHRLSERQHGWVLRSEARVAGYSEAGVRHLVRSGEWELHGRHLLRRAGAPLTDASRLMKAALDAGAGAVLSHRTAAAWWGVPGFTLDPLHVTRWRYSTGAPVSFGQVLHEVVDLTTNQVTALDGIPIVRPDRLAFELHATLHPLRASRAVETMWSMRLVTGRSLRRVHGELAGRGRTGTVASREFLKAHPVDWVPPASGLEGRMMRLLAEDFGRDEFRRQVDLGGEEGWSGRVDFKHRSLPLVIEVQSERYHAALLDRVADAERRRRLERDGFVVLEAWDDEVWNKPGPLLQRIRIAIVRLNSRSEPSLARRF